ncbi:SNF2 family N-terminal domain-containing protein [Thelonectria olida]|uniref:SNF2 family N-terminal domain-containing protein n=1 Tax=Thelonectria olida TaxID=1576542 RepID=A0A9P8VSJ4_9HYPO|nr:SNF2 family N-terminal domain-containing protein [Thelonectria olida]
MLPCLSTPVSEQERAGSATSTRTYGEAFALETNSPSSVISHADTNAPHKEVCYGALYHGSALPSPDSPDGDELSGCSNTSFEGFVTFVLGKRDGYYILESSHGIELALLDVSSSTKLVALQGIPFVRSEAVVDASTVSKRRIKSKRRREPLHLSINIFGPMSSADDVGTRLSKVSAFLQHPKTVPQGVEYHNPQFLIFPEDDTNMNDFIGITNASAWAQKIKISDEVGEIMDSLDDIATESEWQPPTGLVSLLKKHQEDGVQFILQREDKAHRQMLTGELRSATGPGCRGGIIADVMGLGKTLTMLATVLHSLPSAEAFEKFYGLSAAQNSSKVRTRATLVVVSSAQLLESWYSEIETHISPGALNAISFHGQNRARHTAFLASADLVLTTYATIAAEQRGRDILHQVEWYRIVLDEAHWIRNSTSMQFRAVSCLTARSRWCLTGTPIQNNLEDLASLAGFLRLPLAPTRADFRKDILHPLSQGGPNFAKPLRAFLRAYCLRRTEQRLELPKSTQEIVTLQLTPEEQHMYDQVLDQMKGKIDDLVSQGKTIQRYNVLFTAILRMRVLCNIGTLKPSAASSSDFLAQQQGSTWCERCSAGDGDTSMLLASFQFCPDCRRPLHLASPNPGLTPSPRPNELEMNVSRTLESTSELLSLTRLSPQPSGLSTKLSAVVQNVSSSMLHAKHIVFSYWTSTLDLLAGLFKRAGIEYVHIDGRTSYRERSKRLRVFREDGRLPVLLMSIETGAVGLNLTAANRVHIIEPQWNPSVEEQAVARALRMGQKKEVTIFRYIVKGTVEQNIVNLQKKKKNLARFTFDVDVDDNLEEKLDDLKTVLNMGSRNTS